MRSHPAQKLITSSALLTLDFGERKLLFLKPKGRQQKERGHLYVIPLRTKATFRIKNLTGISALYIASDRNLTGHKPFDRTILRKLSDLFFSVHSFCNCRLGKSNTTLLKFNSQCRKDDRIKHMQQYQKMTNQPNWECLWEVSRKVLILPCVSPPSGK